jgi:hypothetical protein
MPEAGWSFPSKISSVIRLLDAVRFHRCVILAPVRP